MLHYCRDCEKEIHYSTWKYGTKRCVKYGYKFRSKIYRGLNSANYIDGRTLKKHYCKELNCNNKICYDNYISGQKRCRSCANKIHSKRMKTKKRKLHTEKTKKQMSLIRIRKGLSKGINNPMFGKPPLNKRNSYKNGYYRKIWMRSNWEILFAKFLDLSNYKWKYESKTFDLGNCTYTPDFYIPEWDCYIEIKGYWREDSIKKFRKFKKKYTNINIKIYNKQKLQTIGVLQ